MTGILEYLLKSALYLTVFLTFFVLFARKTTFFRFNRIALLSGTALCLLMPLFNIRLSIRTESPALAAGDLIDKAVVSISSPAGPVQAGQAGGFNPGALLAILYAAGAIAVTVYFVLAYIRMSRIMRGCSCTDTGSCKVRVADSEMPSFSWPGRLSGSRQTLR